MYVNVILYWSPQGKDSIFFLAPSRWGRSEWGVRYSITPPPHPELVGDQCLVQWHFNTMNASWHGGLTPGHVIENSLWYYHLSRKKIKKNKKHLNGGAYWISSEGVNSALSLKKKKIAVRSLPRIKPNGLILFSRWACDTSWGIAAILIVFIQWWQISGR